MILNDKITKRKKKVLTHTKVCRNGVGTNTPDSMYERGKNAYTILIGKL